MNVKKIPKDQILGHECRFVYHMPKPNEEAPDLHYVKLQTHLKNGKIIPTHLYVENFKRDYWITRPPYRDHNDKKAWEDESKLEKFCTTETELYYEIAKKIGRRDIKNLKQVLDSPYVYGADIMSTALIKEKFNKKYPDLNSRLTVGALDTERDVVRGTDETICITLSMGKHVITAVQKQFVNHIQGYEARTRELFQEYLGRFIKERSISWDLVFVDNEMEMLDYVMAKAHKLKPDIIAIWNINYDVPELLKICERANVDPKHVFNDPSVPEVFREFHYQQGSKQKKTASGKIQPLNWYDQWHTVHNPASFYMVDGACIYRRLRMANGEEPSYALDAILDTEFKSRKDIRKLKFKEADGFSGIDWHKFMQENYILQYIVYNVFDCISMELLDEQTNDIAIAFPMQCENSDFMNFKSQPRRTVDDLHFFVQDRGKVIGTTAKNMSGPLDAMTLGLDNWIVALQAFRVADNGLRLFWDFPELRSNARCHVGDLDVSASYPNGEDAFNIAQDTTATELCKIEGVSELAQRRMGINLSAGQVNAVEICVTLFKAATMDEMLTAFCEDMNIEKPAACNDDPYDEHGSRAA